MWAPRGYYRSSSPLTTGNRNPVQRIQVKEYKCRALRREGRRPTRDPGPLPSCLDALARKEIDSYY